MGIMYWQLDDIWQAPTWASIEYGLKWKMAHYYVRHMYSSIYVFMRLTPYLPSVSNETALISIYFVNDLVNITHNQVNCTIQSFDTFEARLSITYDIVANSTGVELIDSRSYTLLMEQTRCLNSSQCLMLCSLDSNGQQSNEIQKLFFSRPKDVQLYNPNLRTTSIRQRSSTEIDFTINADKPALFVWLDVPNGVSGYFSRNGFHMFKQEITVTFTSWTPLTNFDKANFDLRVTSLYDVTQP
jgi:beta-mannosidase